MLTANVAHSYKRNLLIETVKRTGDIIRQLNITGIYPISMNAQYINDITIEFQMDYHTELF